MSRTAAFPIVAIFVAVFAVSAAGFVASKVQGGGRGDAAVTMAERWMRDDAASGVEVLPGILPPALDQVLNAGITAAADRMALPVHPQARLIGSSYLHQPDGTDLVWVMYDVDGDLAAVTQAVTEQLGRAPWQVTGGIGEETSRLVRFQNSRNADIEGTAIVRLHPGADRYRLMVDRGGREITLEVRLTALTPSVGAGFQPNLSITRVEPGPAQQAGLQAGDRIVRVNDTAVKSAAELAVALRTAANAGPPRAELTYLVAGHAPAAPQPAVFLAPQQAPALPSAFPAAQAWQGLTVVRYGWGQQQGGRAYQASLISKEAPAAVAGRVREALRAAGWQISGDAPKGFATQLQVVRASEGLAGQVTIDQFAQDSAYTEVVVELQSAGPAGRP